MFIGGNRDVKQFLAILTLCAAVVYSTSSFAGQRFGPHVVLERPCREWVNQNPCSASIAINGAISKADAEAFRLVLDEETHRTGKQIKPYVTIFSQGGDVEAAMQIGRDLRRSEGEILGDFPPKGACYSACVLIAAGAVERTASAIGIHRPYFADATTGNLAEADLRYKNLMIDIRNYLREMNMPDEVFQIMQSVGPDEIRKLSWEDAKRLGFIGADPAYEEMQIAAKARRFSLTSAEFRRRQAIVKRGCAQTSSVEGFRHCSEQLTDQIMWGIGHDTLERINRTVREHCLMAEETPPWDECVRSVGQAIKTGQSPTVPSAVAAPKLPPGWRWADEPGSK